MNSYFPSEDEVQERLAALRRQRDTIDRLIADHALYLELGRRLRTEGDATGRADVPAPQPAGHRPGHPVDPFPARPAAPLPKEPHSQPASSAHPLPAPGVPPVPFEADPAAARRYGRALVEAALAVLAEAGRPLHAGEILAGLAARGFVLPGHDPVAALNTRLWKRSGPGGPLRRMGEAVYALSEA